MRRTNSLSIALGVGICLIGILAFHAPNSVNSQSVLSTSTATTTSTPDIVLGPSELSARDGVLRKIKNGIAEFKVPRSWNMMYGLGSGFGNDGYSEDVYGWKPRETALITLLVLYGSSQDVYWLMTQERCRCVDNAREVLESMRYFLQSRGGYQLGEVYSTFVGKWSGYGLEGEGRVFDFTMAPFAHRVFALPDGNVIVFAIATTDDYWKPIKLTFDDILNTISLKDDSYPTLHPLLLTATALQQQIQNLSATPARSSTPQRTQTATP